MRNIVVTGASRGIGLAITRHLVGAGYYVLAVARRSSPELDALIAESPPDAIAFTPCDLSDIDAIPAFVADLRKTHRTFYGLVNNAGIGTEGLLATMPIADMERLVQLNVLSPMVLTRHVLRSMMSAASGRIINMSSIVATTGYSGLSVYAATKSSMLGFTRSLAREVGSLGITVNAVAPGFVDTDMTAGMDQAQRAAVARRAALKRLPEVDDVAQAVAYLLSEGARNVTGTVLTVDAGNTA